MRVIYIVPGSGNTFYCENCLRDVALVRALRRLGHDVVMVPMYLPVFSDDGGPAGSTPVFYGAVNLYLRHRFPALRKSPAWLEKLLDAPALLRAAARKAGSTRARGLEEMTLSMVRGEHGGQAGELERLTAWLEREGKADVVHISTSLLLGLARKLKQRLKSAVVCSLQDEEVWVDAMDEPIAGLIWQTMAERAPEVDAFVAVSRYYADVMRSRLRIPADRMHTVHVGIEVQGHEPARPPPDRPAIGYLSRLSAAEGFGLLVDAWLILKSDPGFAGLKLIATGGQTGDDRRFVRLQRQKLDARRLGADLEVLDEFERPRRLEFLRHVTVLSVPALKGAAFGTYIIEALASGVPVVQPKLGAFPEILAATGGGLLYEPNDAATLADALRSLLRDPARARELGRRGREAVLKDFNIEKTAGDLEKVYRSVVK